MKKIPDNTASTSKEVTLLIKKGVLHLMHIIIMKSSASISLVKMLFPKNPVRFNILTRALEHQCLSCVLLTLHQP